MIVLIIVFTQASAYARNGTIASKKLNTLRCKIWHISQDLGGTAIANVQATASQQEQKSTIKYNCSLNDTVNRQLMSQQE